MISFRNNILIFATVGTIAIISVLAAQYFMILSLELLLKLLFGTSVTLIFFTIFRLNIPNALILFTLLYIKPNFTYITIFIVILIIIFLMNHIKAKNFAVVIPNFYGFILIILCGLIGCLKAYNLNEGIELYLSIIIIPLLLMVLISNSRFNIIEIENIFRFMVIVSACVALYGIIVALRNPGLRIGSFWITAMTINGYYILNLFIAIALIFKSRSRRGSIFYAGLASLIFLGILFTYTRMALLSTVIGFIILSLSTKRPRKYIFMVIILLPIIIPSSLHQRFSLGLIEDYSMIIRYLAWHKSVILIKENLLGIGFNSFAHLYQNMVPLKFLYAEHSHNVYLRFMLELGILGFLAYFYMIISILRSFYFAIKTSSYFLFYLSLIISIIVILIACITDVFIARYSVAIYFWLIMGLMNKLRQIEISNESIT